MKRFYGLVITAIPAFLFIVFINIPQADATANICFCHVTPSTPFTACTSKSGEQNGHFGHGDVPFGCECGDGICDDVVGEDCETCPTDCAPELGCDTCGDGVIDESEECGEDGIDCDTGACVGCRCLSDCGDGVVDTGEQCDGDECCNPDCTLSDAPECQPGGDDSGSGTGGDATAGDGSDGGDATAGDGSDGGDTPLTPAGGQETAGQTGGNGFGCSRDYETTTTSSLSPRDAGANFALLLLPGLFVLLRRRK